MRDSNDYTVKIASNSKRGTGKAAGSVGAQSLLNAFKTVQLPQRDITGESTKPDKTNVVPSQKLAIDSQSQS